MAGDWNTKMIDEFHAKHGKGVGRFGDRLLLLTTRGAKSGETRTTPLAFHRDGDRYVIAATKSGAPTNPGWYYNLVKHKRATIEVGDEKFEVTATPVTKEPERGRLYDGHVAVLPFFAEYPTKTTRVIPVDVLERIAH